MLCRQPSAVANTALVLCSAATLCDLKKTFGDYMGAKLCIGSNGFSGGCPFVSGAMLGACSDQIRASHDLKTVAHVKGITCWPTPSNKAVGALKISLSSAVETAVLGNTSLTPASANIQATSLLIPESANALEVRMWYSTELDVSNRSQVGRIYIKISRNMELDCGDQSLPFDAYDLRLVDDAEEGGAIGSILVGLMVASTNVTNGQAGSITAINWLFLKRVVSGGVTVSPLVGSPLTCGRCGAGCKQQSARLR